MKSKSTGKRVVYWDTCVFLAWIKDEKIWPDDVMKGIEQIVEEVERKRTVVVTSVITICEILEADLVPAQRDKYRNLFKNRQIQAVAVDTRVSERAAIIRNFYLKDVLDENGRKTGKKKSKISLGDALQVASALHYRIPEFQTLDGWRTDGDHKGLLALNGEVAEFRLAIVPPKYIAPPQPLDGPPQKQTKAEQMGLFATGQDEAELTGQEPDHETPEEPTSVSASDPDPSTVPDAAAPDESAKERPNLPVEEERAPAHEEVAQESSDSSASTSDEPAKLNAESATGGGS